MPGSATAIAALGMLAQEKNVENISNNLANLSTNAFWKREVRFQELMPQTVSQMGAATSTSGSILNAGIQIGSGVRVSAITPNTVQGSSNNTGRPFDLMISGQGFFQVELPDGTLGYTRDGYFEKSPEGLLVTVDGYTLVPGITIAEDVVSVTINKSGQVIAMTQSKPDPQTLGQIDLARFNNPAGLKNIGGNIYVESAASGAPAVGTAAADGFGSINQFFIESSNVDAVLQVTDLIKCQRGYEMCSKALEADNEMQKQTGSIRI